MTNTLTQQTTMQHQFYDLVQRTPAMPFDAYDVPDVWLKDETRQSVGSFKLRGALNRILEVANGDDSTACVLENGIYTASAGNHAQGVALAATYLGFKSEIFLPRGTASTKVEAIELLGGNIHYVDGAVDEALCEARARCDEKDGCFVHPFDDWAVIAGQASIGREIASESVSFDSVFVPVGGGGLLAGTCQGLQGHGSSAQVFGVQLEGCNAFTRAIEQGGVVELTDLNTLADGTAVKKAGELTLQLVTQQSPNFAGMIVVSQAELKRALDELNEGAGIYAETAAGLSLAGLRQHRESNGVLNQKGIAVVTGKHRDQSRYESL